MFTKKRQESSTMEEIRSLLSAAIEMRASDIHIEPFADFIRVRLRIDGTLVKHCVLPVEKREEIAAIIKVMADLDSTRKREAQDGRLSFFHKERPIEVRASVLPFKYGEKIVLRLQNTDRVELNIDTLGLSCACLPEIKRVIAGQQGLILVTGSTGSGKTTTIYAMLSHIASDEVNIVTLEDPIEYEIEGFIQMQMTKESSMSYADALKAVLRQDPDVLVIGEIRDGETARIAIRAALTGHLVFASLHTNDAIDTLIRLREMGIEPYLIAAALKLISYQRLVRILCTSCKTATTPSPEAATLFGLDRDSIVYAPRGCKYCNNSGYHGRKPLFQLLLVDDDISEILAAGEKSSELRHELQERLTTSLLSEARHCVIDNLTSCEEAMKNCL